MGSSVDVAVAASKDNVKRLAAALSEVDAKHPRA
jgi:hypothetical protein